MKNKTYKTYKTYLDFPLEVKAIAEDGFFTGYASVFGVEDKDRDIIIPGAFHNTLGKGGGGKTIQLLWQHKSDEPIGVIHTLREDHHGLYVEGQVLLDLQRGREAYALLKSGALGGLSIGYNAVTYDIDNATGVRLLKEIDLWEISLVTFPANPLAGVRTIKASLPATLREFEHFLREAGFSRNRAKSISISGFDFNKKQWDAVGEESLAAFDDSIERAVEALSF